MDRIRTVTVIGAAGTMGANVAGIFASFGDAKVYCIGRDEETVKRAIPRIINSVRTDSIRSHLIPKDYTEFEKCIRESDLVYESVAEDITVKKSVAERVAKSLRKDAISCTGSSGLSITEIADCYPDDLKKNFYGVHMFNPPYKMTLCELIPTKYSDTEITKKIKDYLEQRLLRTVVEVSDTPAFLSNRIGFYFINEALQYAEIYKDSGGIDYIDAILGTFTGRAMPPIATADFVGLDVHKAIVDNLYHNTNDFGKESFRVPSYVEKLIEKGKYGRKSGEGLYKTVRYDERIRKRMVYDIPTGEYRETIDYSFPFSEEMKKHIAEGDYELAFKVLFSNHSAEAGICRSFLLKYIVYSIYTAQRTACDINAADDVMAEGFSWCPPLALYHALNTAVDVDEYIRQMFRDNDKIDIEKVMSDIVPSRYDYRSFFKTGR